MRILDNHVWGMALATASIMIGTAAQAQTTAGARADEQQDARTPESAPVAVGSEAGAASGSASERDIIVTGSRIARRDYNAVSPVTTQSAEQIRDTGAVTLDAAINQLPQFTPAGGAANGSLFGARATLNLRGLGATRNLVLLDGRRLPPSTTTGVVDINNIPTALLSGVEVVTGGASAVYGSDAIAGVVNFQLNKRLRGLIADAQIGATTQGDSMTLDASLSGGAAFADDRGSVIFSVEYVKRDPVLKRARSFFDRATTSAVIASGIYTPSASNLPSQAAINSVFSRYGTSPGSVTNQRTLSVNENRSLFALTGPVNYRGPMDGYLVQGGSLVAVTGGLNHIQAELERYSGFFRFDYELGEGAKPYVQILAGQQNTVANFEPYGTSATTQFSMPSSNPFIPADLRTILASRRNPTADFIYNNRFNEVGPRTAYNEITYYQAVVGVAGKLPVRDWTYDVNFSRGSTKSVQENTGYISISGLNSLLRAPDGGASICAGGYDPFGLTPISNACQSIYSPRTLQTVKVVREIAELIVQGGLFDLPAGDVRFAAGLSRRTDRADDVPDAGFQSGDTLGAGRLLEFHASDRVSEAYVELSIPILKDLPLIREFTILPAYRYSDYRSAGPVSTYKIEADWKLADALRVRGGYQRAVRAPNLAELYSGQVEQQLSIGLPSSGGGDPCDVRSSYRTGSQGSAVRALCLAQGVPGALIDSYQYPAALVFQRVFGNSDLKPEKADTFTVGAVLHSPFNSPLLSNISLSVDYYHIRLKGAISPIPGADVLNRCFNGDGSNPGLSATNFYCTNVTRIAATGEINGVRTPYLNLGGYRLSGIDTQLDWTIRLGDLGAGDARVNLNAVWTYTQEFSTQVQQGGNYVDLIGTIGSPDAYPRWRGTTTLTFATGGFRIGGTWRYTSAMDDRTVITRPASPAPGVAAYSYFDINANIDVNDRFELRAGMINIGDKQPPVVGGVASNTDLARYDVLGRRFFVGAKVKF